MFSCQMSPLVDDQEVIDSVLISPNDSSLLLSDEERTAVSSPIRLVFPAEGMNRRSPDWLFPLILVATVTLCIGGGIIARNVPPVQKKISRTVHKIKTEFRITEQKKIEKPPEPEQVEKKQPIDLGEKPVETPLPEPLPEQVEQSPAEPVETPPQKVRKVFGLRRVYSTGLGSGGSMSGAVVGKIGNTINKEYDTITATKADIKGAVVSAATVTTAPRFRKVVKPVYTKDMIDQKIQGTVKVRVLVDIDGKVKKATCLNDIGGDSAAQAIKATMAMEFDPATRNEEAVAVWIVVPIKFVLLG